MNSLWLNQSPGIAFHLKNITREQNTRENGRRKQEHTATLIKCESHNNNNNFSQNKKSKFSSKQYLNKIFFFFRCKVHEEDLILFVIRNISDYKKKKKKKNQRKINFQSVLIALHPSFFKKNRKNFSNAANETCHREALYRRAKINELKTKNYDLLTLEKIITIEKVLRLLLWTYLKRRGRKRKRKLIYENSLKNFLN